MKHEDFETFLENWTPSEVFQHACIPSNLHDPLALARLLENYGHDDKLSRTPFANGEKTVSPPEAALRQYEFIRKNRRT